MKAVSCINGNNHIGILCEGKDVLQNKNCKLIAIKGKQFRVKDAEISNSLSDTLGLWLVLDTNNLTDIPLGQVQVIA